MHAAQSPGRKPRNHEMRKTQEIDFVWFECFVVEQTSAGHRSTAGFGPAFFTYLSSQFNISLMTCLFVSAAE